MKTPVVLPVCSHQEVSERHPASSALRGRHLRFLLGDVEGLIHEPLTWDAVTYYLTPAEVSTLEPLRLVLQH